MEKFKGSWYGVQGYQEEMFFMLTTMLILVKPSNDEIYKAIDKANR